MLGAVVALTSGFEPATAEGFFQKLFGWGSSRRSERIAPPTFNFGYGGQRFDYGQGYGQGYGDSGWPQDYSRYRTLCVRTCDGYYFPISYSTVPSKFAEDERLCQRLCPASEALLYSHRNPGEDVTQSVSVNGQPYSALPNALSYRKQYNPACSCRAPGQSWAEALRQLDDQTIERGDIVVTEEKAKLLSQPRVDAQGKPISLDASPPRPASAPKGGGPKSAAAAPSPPPVAASPTPEEKVEEDPAKRKVRPIGPTFYSVR
jgi:hypothetical protein